MIYIYRRERSDGARQLAEMLGGRRAREMPRLLPDNLIVCWGEAYPVVDGLPYVLNGAPIRSKYHDAQTLKAAGVATIEVSQTRPTTEVIELDPAVPLWEAAKVHVEEFLHTAPQRTPIYLEGLAEMRESIRRMWEVLEQPFQAAGRVVPLDGWMPRSNSHVGGNDLLNPPAVPDYWVKKEELVREYRVHSFDGRSIRAGVKVPREGYGTPGGTDNPTAPNYCHSWIRSWDAGWRIRYDGNTIRQAHRDLAHQAVAAIGLTFGAVDLGERQDGSLIVLEVNRAPGLEGGTIVAYANAIKRWMEEE